MTRWIVLLACTFALSACDTMSGKSSGESATPASGSNSSGSSGSTAPAGNSAGPSSGGQWGGGSSAPIESAPAPAYPSNETPRQ